MKMCRRCGVTVEHGQTCKRCGAFLVEITEPGSSAPMPPEAAPPADPGATLPLPSGAWRCPGCSEVIDAAFAACWQCGTENPAAESVAPEAEDSGSPEPEPRGAALFCTRCSSDKVIPGQIVEDSGEHGSEALHTLVFARPDAWIFKDSLRGKLLADICGACGHVEWHVANPSELYQHYLRSRIARDHS